MGLDMNSKWEKKHDRSVEDVSVQEKNLTVRDVYHAKELNHIGLKRFALSIIEMEELHINK